MAYSNTLINKCGNIKKTYESADMEDLSSDYDDNSAKTKEKKVCHLSVRQPCNIDHETGGPFDPIVSLVAKEPTMTPVSNFDGARRPRQGGRFTSDGLNISKEYNQVNITKEANFEESGTHTQKLIEYSVKEPLRLFGEERPISPTPKQKNEDKNTKCVDNDETAACPTDGQKHSSCNTKRDSVDVVSLAELGTPEQYQVSFQTAVVAENASIQTVTGIADVSVHTAAVTEQVSAHSTAHRSCNTKRVDVVSLAELGTPEQYTIENSAGKKCIQITKKLQAPDRSEHAVEQVSSVQAKACVQHSIPLKTATIQVHSAAIDEDCSVQTTAIIYVTVQTATTTEQFSAQATAAQDQVSFQTTIVTEDASIQTVTGIDDVSVHTAAVTEQVSAQAAAAQDQVSFQTTIVAEDASIQTVTGIDDVSVHTAAVTEQVSAQAAAAQDQVSFQTAIVAENASMQMVTGIDDVSVHTAAATEEVSAHSTAAVDQILFHTAVVTEDVSIQTATTIHDVSVHTAEATDVIERVPVQTVLVTDVSVQSADVKENVSDQEKRHQDTTGMDPQRPLLPFGQLQQVSHVLPQQTCTSPEQRGFPQELPPSNPAPVSSCPVKDTLTLETFHQAELSRHTELEANTENVQQSPANSVETFGHQTATPRHPEIQTSEEVMPPMQLRRLVAVHSTRPDENFPYNDVVLRASAIDARGVMLRRENHVPERHVQGSHVPGIRVRRGTPVHTPPHPGVGLRRVRPCGPVVVTPTRPVEYNYYVDLRSCAVDLQDKRDLREDWAADVDVRHPGLRPTGLPQAVRGASGLRIQNPYLMTSDMSADERGRLPSQLRHLLDHELMATLSQDLGSRRGPVVVTCVVCSSRPVSVLTFNCTHRVVCIVCFLQRRLRRCPLLWCQRPILFYWSSGSQHD
ncbi:mucin-17-like [Littorina saxatilis]|uniref:mucin-17-like n=1 Tax=Littorina saxatilis TaxID=31220 RepID=UPI0038B46154